MAWETQPGRVHWPGAGLLAAGVLLALASGVRPPGTLWLTLAGLAVAWGCWVAAARVQEPRLRDVLLWAVAVRLIGLGVIPAIEDDFWRYVWDGYLFARTGTPYGHVPADWFGDGSVAPALEPALSGINYPHLPTIYGPLVEGLFLLGGWLAPGALWPLKVFLLFAELATWCLLRPHLSTRALLLLAWCPLAIHETAFNAHFEAVPVLFLLAAFVWASAGRGFLSGLALGAALACRPFALLFAPFLLARARVPASGAGLLAGVGLAYGPVLAGGGIERPGVFATHWEFNSTIYALVQAVSGPGAARWISAGLIGVVCAAVWWWERGRRGMLPRGEFLMGGMLLCAPVANPWYALWMVPFTAMRPAAWAWSVPAVISLSYVTLGNLDGTGDYRHAVWVRPAEVALVLLAAALARRGWKNHGGGA